MCPLWLDAEKAFDCVEWDYLWVIPKHFGLAPSFSNMVRTLYSGPTARVQTRHTGTCEFELHRSIKRGCPLSPGLFVLSLEPLAQVVRQHRHISPISIMGTAHSISLYADNILLYLSDLINSVPTIQSWKKNDKDLVYFVCFSSF